MEEKAAEVVKVVAASMEVALAVLAVDGVAGVATTTATSTADERRAHRCWVAAHGSLIGDSVPSREQTGTLGLGQGEGLISYCTAVCTVTVRSAEYAERVYTARQHAAVSFRPGPYRFRLPGW